MVTPSLGEVSSQAEEEGTLCPVQGWGGGQDYDRKRTGRQVLGWVSQQWVRYMVSRKRGRDNRRALTGLCGNIMQEGGEKPQAVLIPGTSSQLAH